MIVAVDSETGKVLGQVPVQTRGQRQEWPAVSYPTLKILTKDGYVYVPTHSVRVEEIK